MSLCCVWKEAQFFFIMFDDSHLPTYLAELIRYGSRLEIEKLKHNIIVNKGGYKKHLRNESNEKASSNDLLTFPSQD